MFGGRTQVGTDDSTRNGGDVVRFETPALDPETEAQLSLSRLPEVSQNERSIICCCISSESALRFFLLTYWIWSLLSFIDNVHIIFPVLYLFPLVSMLLAFVGLSTATFHMLIPFLFMSTYEMLYGAVCFFYLVNFHVNDQGEKMNEWLYKNWPEMASEFYTMDRQGYEMYLVMISFKILYATVGAVLTGQEIARLRVAQFVEARRHEIFRYRQWREEQQQRHFPFNGQHPYGIEFSNWYASIPPPPAYETSTAFRMSPVFGSPPPTYSTVERDQLQGRETAPQSLPATEISVLSPPAPPNGSIATSMNCKNTDAAPTVPTAMPPSIIFHSPPSSVHTTQ